MDSELKAKLSKFALTVSAEDRALRTLINGNKVTLALLKTAAKDNLVAAINETFDRAIDGVSLEDVDTAVQDYFVLHPQSYVHDQAQPSDAWVILHPLDHAPAVSVTDSAGTSWVGQVSHPTPNQVIVRFNLPLTGKAVLT